MGIPHYTAAYTTLSPPLSNTIRINTHTHTQEWILCSTWAAAVAATTRATAARRAEECLRVYFSTAAVNESFV